MSDISNAVLLPANATQLEVDVDSLFDHKDTLEPSVLNMRTAKLVDIPDTFVPWLVYEYGLEEVLPWITDPREAMRSGIQWQRIKGTPEALRIALSWVGFIAERVEEEETGEHFFEFQIQINGVPVGRELLDSIVVLAKLSAPLRSRLSRLYNEENDIRRFVLDKSDWGDLLSDYSGILDSTGTRLSFGRDTVSFIQRLEQSNHSGVLRQHDLSFTYRSGFLLDYSDWGEIPILESDFIRGRLVQFGTEDSVQVGQMAQTRHTFSRSQLVLSDSDPLGSIHTELSGGFAEVEYGETFVLDDSLLSEVKRDIKLVNIDERIDNTHEAILAVSDFEAVISMNHERQTSLGVSNYEPWVILSESQPVYSPTFIRLSERIMSAKYEGQIWTGNKWPLNGETWKTINVIIGVSHVSSS